MTICPMYRTKSYEPSLSDGRYWMSGMVGSRSQIFAKDSVLKNYS
jgi:hypothetical protein